MADEENVTMDVAHHVQRGLGTRNSEVEKFIQKQDDYSALFWDADVGFFKDPASIIYIHSSPTWVSFHAAWICLCITSSNAYQQQHRAGKTGVSWSTCLESHTMNAMDIYFYTVITDTLVVTKIYKISTWAPSFAGIGAEGIHCCI